MQAAASVPSRPRAHGAAPGGHGRPRCCRSAAGWRACGMAGAERARRLARLGPDVLKLQYPGSARLCEALTRACGAIPWVLLGGGTDEDNFLNQLREAMHGGARGYSVGRTAWDAALAPDEGDQSRAVPRRAAFLARAVQVAEAR